MFNLQGETATHLPINLKNCKTGSTQVPTTILHVQCHSPFCGTRRYWSPVVSLLSLMKNTWRRNLGWNEPSPTWPYMVSLLWMRWGCTFCNKTKSLLVRKRWSERGGERGVGLTSGSFLWWCLALSFLLYFYYDFSQPFLVSCNCYNDILYNIIQLCHFMCNVAFGRQENKDMPK